MQLKGCCLHLERLHTESSTYRGAIRNGVPSQNHCYLYPEVKQQPVTTYGQC